MATIRKDGAPRLHPLCPALSQGKLYILVAPASPKKWDLLRDGRYAMQTFPEARPDSDEFYFTGIATAVEDQGIFESVLADARHVASEEEVLVQAAKSPMGTKGARISSYISLPGRFLVLMPTSDHIGVSRRIEDEIERERLKGMVQKLRRTCVGYCRSRPKRSTTPTISL